MAFGGFNSEGASQPMAEINMIPLIDVMLVLLVIFMVTAPLLTHAIKINLPNASKPEVHLRADQATQYQKLAEVLAAARNARVARIGFITEPNRK
jgi:biopolymer transport protein ExbD